MWKTRKIRLLSIVEHYPKPLNLRWKTTSPTLVYHTSEKV
jgi:hypothetical protein